MANGFNPKSYLEQEADEIASQFLTLRKQDLVDLGLHLELSVKTTMRKTMLQEIVLDYLESEEIVPEGSIEISVGSFALFHLLRFLQHVTGKIGQQTC